MSNEAAVRLSGLGKVFGHVEALRDISLRIEAGELVAVIGPSGCGKSTLLRILADLEMPTHGAISVFGKTPREARLAQDFGIAFQQAGLMQWRTVRENIELPLQMRKQSLAQRRARCDELLELIGLEEFADHRPDQLSGGMQQRVAMARSLACKPALLLMDEPFGALDEMTRERLQAELLRIATDTGAAVVLITHSIAEAVFVADRVVVMSARPGQIRSIISVGIDHGGTDELTVRESPEYFAAITEVREALRADHSPVRARS